MLTLSSCLVDDPPPFPESKQTPPRLDLADALPRPNQVVVAQSGQTLHFTIPVAAEDAGDKINAQLLLDYMGGASTNVARDNVNPSTLADTTRSFTLNWFVDPNSVTAGCHRLTLRVTHAANLIRDLGPLVVNQADLAEAYWWAVIDADPALGTKLTDCPGALGGKL